VSEPAWPGATLVRTVAPSDSQKVRKSLNWYTDFFLKKYFVKGIARFIILFIHSFTKIYRDSKENMLQNANVKDAPSLNFEL
jgi:hypothetical protein